MPDVMSQINDLKSLPDQALQFELANPSGAVPAYLVLAEAQRRQLLRSAAQAQQSNQPIGSVYDDVIRSMMARQPPPGVAPAGMTPPPMSPPSQPQNARPPLAMAEGGDVDEDDGDDAPRVSSTGSANREKYPVTEMPGARFNALINDAAVKYGLDPSDLYGIMRAESSGNPRAQSDAGAIGLMQVLPSTARQYGYGPRDLWNPAHNIDAGAHYYSDMLDRFGDKTLARAAYNAGPGAVSKYGDVPPFFETQKYIKRVNQFAQQYKGMRMANLASDDAVESENPLGDFSPDPKHPDMAADAGPTSGTSAGTSGLASLEPPAAGADAGGPVATPDNVPFVTDAGPHIGLPTQQQQIAALQTQPGGSVSVPGRFDQVAPTPPAQLSDADTDLKEWRNRIQKMWDEAEARRHPKGLALLFNALGNFGAGMAQTPARNWGGALAAGAAGMSRGFAADQEAARQQELKLLGVGLDLDKQVQDHQDKLAQLHATAQNEAFKSHDEAYIKGGILGVAGQPGPGPQYIAEPLYLQPGHVVWHLPNTSPVTEDIRKFLPENPAAGTMLPTTDIEAAKNEFRKAAETIAVNAAKPSTSRALTFPEQQARNRAIVQAQQHPEWGHDPKDPDLYDHLMQDAKIPDDVKRQIDASDTAKQPTEQQWQANREARAQQIAKKKKLQVDWSKPIYPQLTDPDDRAQAMITPEQEAAAGAREDTRKAAEQTREDNALFQNYNRRIADFNKIYTPTQDKAARVDTLLHNLDTGISAADAMAIPQLLVTEVSGQGSGVRLTQPEINNVLGSRSIWNDLQVALQRFKDGDKLAPEQRDQIRTLVGYLRTKAQAKLDAMRYANDQLDNAKDRGAQNRAMTQMRNELEQLETQPYYTRGQDGKLQTFATQKGLNDYLAATKKNAPAPAGAPGTVRVISPSGQTGSYPANKPLPPGFKLAQ